MAQLSDMLELDLPTTREEEAMQLLQDFERAMERSQEIESDFIDANRKVKVIRDRLLERLGVRV
jgi:hypothetical protein